MFAGTALAAALFAGGSADAQIATLGKGHNLLVSQGLQIWGCDTGGSDFNYANLTNANMNGVMWSFGQSEAHLLTTGQKWGKWVDAAGTPGTALTSAENARYADLVALQVGDEQQSDIENPNGSTQAWFKAARDNNSFADKLLYINSFYVQDINAYVNFIANANPDAISFDSYPFGNPGGFSPYNWLGKAQGFRRLALGSHIGATGTAARPYGLYLQTYTGSDATREASDVEMRWQQFTAWTMGYTFVDAFTVGGGSTLFQGGGMANPAQPRYDQFKESARQGRNLGPALTRLVSHGYGSSIIPGKDAVGNTNAVPVDWLAFNKDNAPASQRYLTGVSAANLGVTNGGNPGDVYVGFFNPLHASFGEAGDVYFMVTNALGAYLNDSTTTVAQTQQQITLDLDTQYSGISTLQRLSRTTGQLEIVPLTRTTARQYQLQFTLDGGTGDLFKYNDGSQFVGFNNTLHWDNNAGANNTTTGAGLGGGGSWDGSSNRWDNGSSNGPWVSNRDAVFTGSPGTVTLAAPQSVNSLTFKSNGYQLTGSTLTMAGQHITTDSAATATIGSTVAGTGGIVKAGPGTLVLSNNANTYTGGTTVTGGVLQIGADGTMGPAPSTFTAANIILNGGTLKFGADLDISNNRGIDVGPAGGTIDTQNFSNAAGYNAFQGGFRGPGHLTKLGSGTFFAAATTGGANTSWTGNLILKEGTWKILASDGLPFNPPVAAGLQAAQVTLDGGTWQIGASMSVTNARRGITVAAGGGTIDTQGFNLTWAGPLAGNVSTSTLNKIGSGVLRLNTIGSVPASYAGVFNVNAGTLQLDGGAAMGDLAAINLANAPATTLNITGNETIGSLSGGGSNGGNVTLGGLNLTAGGNGRTTQYGGTISGSGSLTKTGGGTMTLSAANTFTGGTIVSGGTLVIGHADAIRGGALTVNNATAQSQAGLPKAISVASIATTGTGKLDLVNNGMVVKSSTLAAVDALVTQGYNNGNWLGSGIASSTAATDPSGLTAVGYFSNAEFGATEFEGVTGLDNNDVLVKYTYYGDADLNGVVDPDDFNQFLAGFQDSSLPRTWLYGDFDYNNVIDPDDFNLFLAAFQNNGAQLSELEHAIEMSSLSSADQQMLLGAIAAVPEPASLGTLGIALGGLLARRRQRA